MSFIIRRAYEKYKDAFLSSVVFYSQGLRAGRRR